MKNPETISQRAGWTFAGAYNSLMSALSTGMYAHEVQKLPPLESSGAATTVGLLTAAICAGLYRRDRHIRELEAQQSTINFQQPQPPTHSTPLYEQTSS